MKDAWCLATSLADATSREIIDLYAKRWTIEPSFRDTKDLRFGMGLGTVRIENPQRRDRLLLVNAFAIVLLTLLGTAGEALGMDRHLKSNTAKHRQTPHPLGVSPGLHALRIDSDHAGRAPAASDGKIIATYTRIHGDLRRVCGGINEGMAEISTYGFICVIIFAPELFGYKYFLRSDENRFSAVTPKN